MQKGTMMTGIADGVLQLSGIFHQITKAVKENGLITDKEYGYIAAVFGERIKQGNQFIEKVKDLLSPKQKISEEEKIKQLEQMYSIVKSQLLNARKFEKGFERLCAQRKKRLTDTQEIERLLKEKGNKKDKVEKKII
ncbi:MAG: hypothetical protein J0I09_07850 [Sphingobacteriia bacterium]|nr:hypothetical protein [Sphingobacteriia bacterium]